MKEIPLLKVLGFFSSFSLLEGSVATKPIAVGFIDLVFDGSSSQVHT